MNTTFSIVVPVYNTNLEFLSKCLESIVNQTYEEFECIVVDDGSNSADYIDALELLCSSDDRIRLFTLDHHGNSYARNYGIAVAKMDYLMFVDSDDVISPYLLEEAAKIINDNNPDLVMGLVKGYDGSHIEFYQSNAYLSERLLCYRGYDAMGDVFEHILGCKKDELSFSNGYISGGPVARIIKAPIAKECPFPTGNLLTEDVIWNCVVMSHIDSLVIVPEVWYGYYQYYGSKSRKYYKDGMRLFNEQIDAYCKYINECWPDRKNGLYMKLWQEIAMYFRIYLNDKSIKWSTRYSCYKDIFRKPAYISMINNIDFSYESNQTKRFIKCITRDLIRIKVYLPTWFVWKSISNKSL